jgi:hypothetical protein
VCCLRETVELQGVAIALESHASWPSRLLRFSLCPVFGF